MQRRSFIKNTCGFCLMGAAGFALSSQLQACSPAKYTAYKAAVNNNTVQVPLTLFATSALQLVRPGGWYVDIAVQKNADDTYQALLLECTHQENRLDPTGNGYHCSLHGSEFDKSGNVRKGPAELPLKKLKTSIDQNNLIIHV